MRLLPIHNRILLIEFFHFAAAFERHIPVRAVLKIVDQGVGALAQLTDIVIQFFIGHEFAQRTFAMSCIQIKRELLSSMGKKS